MSDPAPAADQPRFPSGFVVFLMHALVGPPVGAFLIWAIMFAQFLLQGKSSPGWSENPLSLLGYFAAWSYVFGGPQAFLCGLLVGVRTSHRGRYTYLECVAAALAAECVVALLMRRQQLMWPLLESVMYYGALGIAAALVLRALMPWIANYRARKP